MTPRVKYPNSFQVFLSFTRLFNIRTSREFVDLSLSQTKFRSLLRSAKCSLKTTKGGKGKPFRVFFFFLVRSVAAFRIVVRKKTRKFQQISFTLFPSESGDTFSSSILNSPNDHTR